MLAAHLRFLALPRDVAGRDLDPAVDSADRLRGGLVILLIAFVDEFIHVIRGNLPRYEKPKPTTAEEVVERAVQSGV